jgi:hypothetical protein
MRYEYQTPDMVRERWDFIRFGLSRILRKSPEPYIAEDVYLKLGIGKAFLWMALADSGNAEGFFILEKNGDTCHIWCAWAVAPNLLEDGVAHIETLAREFGANKLTFDTNRVGWVKVADKLGFKPRTWVKELK